MLLPLHGSAQPRLQKTINRDWNFQYFPSEKADAGIAAPGYDDSRWPAVALPHTWSTYETTRELHPFIRSASERDDSYWWYGWGWYRKRFRIDRRHAARLVSLEFDGVQKYSRVYINGKLAGEHRGGYTSFSVDITPYIRFGEENVLAVQVSNRRDDPYGRIPPMTAGNFDVYGGIYRDVRLVIRNRLHVPFQGSAEQEGGTFITTPEVSESRATVKARTWVRNDYAGPRDCSLVTAIVDAGGETVARSESRYTIEPGAVHQFEQMLGPINRPRLWSPDSPYLYQVRTEVRDGQTLYDTYTSPLGFRWFSWNHEQQRLYLNGKKLLLRGINRHQEYPWLGDAMPKWMHRKDLEDIRNGMGLYFQRTAHYPQDPFVYDLCDRLGIIVIEEVPNIKDIAFGRDVQRQNVKEMIRRDRNHPSIFIWSIGNETNQPADSASAREEDQTRLIYLRRGQNGGSQIDITDKDLAIENLLRCTIRGWYNSDDRDFGPETRNPKSGQVTGTEEWQHRTDAESPKLLGDDNVVVWLYADHGADREYLNSPLKHLNPKGWVDAYRFPKYVYYLWQANFTSKPMVFIHPHYWRAQYLGQRKDIVVDSNCNEVELKVNGAGAGKQRPSAENAHSVTFKGVQVQRGTLTAACAAAVPPPIHGDTGTTKTGAGLRDAGGTMRAQASVTLAGAPSRIVLSTSATQVPADRAGIAVIAADIVDANGVHVYGANPPLAWRVAGPAVLVGPSVYQSDTEKNGAMEGTMYIDAPVANLVRSTATPGAATITVSAPGLQSGSITIRTTPPVSDAIEGIVEPPLRDEGRRAVARDQAFRSAAVAAPPRVIAEIKQDYDFTAGSLDQYRVKLDQFIREKNPGVDTAAPAYQALLGRLAALLVERNGHLVADDYNFAVRNMNSQRARPKAK